MDSTAYLAAREECADGKQRTQLFRHAMAKENEDRAAFASSRDSEVPGGSEEGEDVVVTAAVSRRDSDSLYAHPHPSMIPVFPVKPQAFNIEPQSNSTRKHRLFPVTQRKVGSSSICSSLTEFQHTFLEVFCEGTLRFLDWNNVFVGGGSVLACLQPIPARHSTPAQGGRFDEVQRVRKHFQTAYPASDIDLFLYGLSETEARAKIEHIYEAIQRACPHKVVCFRSSSAVTMVSRFPFRHVQVVLRLYSSPYEILAGFDVDASDVGFDGNQVYCGIRGHHALVTCSNTIDLTRRSPSYEVRLAKYGLRGFEVDLDDILDPASVDPSVFARSWTQTRGLARLLVLERLRTPAERAEFLGISLVTPTRQNFKRIARQFGNRDTAQESVEYSNYSTVYLPFAEGVDADLCMKMMAAKDKDVNSAYLVEKRGGYNLHPCFFGSAQEIMEDRSQNDPPLPGEISQEHRDLFVRGPLKFITDNPGRQRIGSFHPLDEDGWTTGTVMTQAKEDFLHAIHNNDVDVVARMLKRDAVAAKELLNSVDVFGRSPFSLSIICGSLGITRTLLEADPEACSLACTFRSNFRFNALQLSMFHGRVSHLQLLLQFLKDLNLPVEREDGDYRETPALVVYQMSLLDVALALGRFDCAKALLESGWKIPRKNCFGLPPTAFLAEEDALEGVTLLCDLGGFDPRDRYGNSMNKHARELNAVHAAVVHPGRPRLLEALLRLRPEATLQAANTFFPGTSNLTAPEASGEVFDILYRVPGIQVVLTQELLNQQPPSPYQRVKAPSGLVMRTLKWMQLQLYSMTPPGINANNELLARMAKQSAAAAKKSLETVESGLLFANQKVLKAATVLGSEEKIVAKGRARMREYRCRKQGLSESEKSRRVALFLACAEGEIDRIRHLAESGLVFADVMDDDGVTCLHVAVYFNQVAVANEIAHQIRKQWSDSEVEATEKRRGKSNVARLVHVANMEGVLQAKSALKDSCDDDDDDSNEEEDEEDDSDQSADRAARNPAAFLHRQAKVYLVGMRQFSGIHGHLQDKLYALNENIWAASLQVTARMDAISMAILDENHELLRIVLGTLKAELKLGTEYRYESLGVSILCSGSVFKEIDNQGKFMTPIDMALLLDDPATLAILLENGAALDSAFAFHSFQVASDSTGQTGGSETEKLGKYQGLKTSALYPNITRRVAETADPLLIEHIPPMRKASLISRACSVGAAKCIKEMLDFERSDVGKAVRAFCESSDSWRQFASALSLQYPKLCDAQGWAVHTSSNQVVEIVRDLVIGRDLTARHGMCGITALNTGVINDMLPRILAVVPVSLFRPQPVAADAKYYAKIKLTEKRRWVTLDGSGDATPLALAVAKRDTSLVKYMVENVSGVDVDQHDPRMGGKTLFGLACAASDFATVSYLVTCCRFETLLVGGNDGVTPMMTCARNSELGKLFDAVGEEWLAKLLCAQEVLHRRDIQGRCLLHHVTQQPPLDERLVRFLSVLEKPFEIESFSSGATPLDILNVTRLEKMVYNFDGRVCAALKAEATVLSKDTTRTRCTNEQCRKSRAVLLDATGASRLTESQAAWRSLHGIPYDDWIALLVDNDYSFRDRTFSRKSWTAFSVQEFMLLASYAHPSS